MKRRTFLQGLMAAPVVAYVGFKSLRLHGETIVLHEPLSNAGYDEFIVTHCNFTKADDFVGDNMIELDGDQSYVFMYNYVYGGSETCGAMIT